MDNDLISREALKKYAIPCEIHNGALTELCVPLYQIDCAPTVETDIEVVAKDAYEQGYADGWKERFGELEERPQGEWEIGYTAKQKKVAVCNLCNCISFQGKTNFCHSCGAEMQRGGEKNGQS